MTTELKDPPCADDLGLICGDRNKIKYPGHKPLHGGR